MRMSSKPAAAITSASPSFWQVMPLAPAPAASCDDGALVRLDVRPVGNARGIAGGLQARDIALDPVEVHGPAGVP